MSERLRSMARIVAVQAGRKRLAAWTLAQAEARRAALVAARTDLGAYVEAENLTGPLATLALAQTRRLAEREASNDAECEGRRATLREAERRHRLAERILDRVTAEARAHDERRALERLIEDVVARRQEHGQD